MHELGLVGQPSQSSPRSPAVARLHDAEIDLLVVEAGVLLLMRRRRPMKIARATRRVAE